MANTFKALTLYATTGAGTTFTCPTGGTIVVVGLNVTSNQTVNTSYSIKLVDNSTSRETYLTYNTILPPNNNHVIAGGDQKVVLESQDELVFTCNVANGVHIHLSYMLIS